MCADALRLWRETQAAAKRSARCDDSGYRAACHAFDRHYRQQKPRGGR
jgi:hypothetical protein